MKKRTLSILSIMMAVILLLSFIPVQAEEEGRITITIGDKDSEFQREGIQLGIYLLATGNYGDWTMVDTFKDIDVFTRKDGSTNVGTSLNQISKRIEDRKVKPADTQTSDEEGFVEKDDSEEG